MQTDPSCPEANSPSATETKSFVDRAMAWFLVSERDSRWIRWGLGLAACLYLACLAKLEVGPVNRWGADVFLLSDGAWRLLNGQVPYRDFYLALGPLEYMVVAFGMLFTGGTPQGIAVGNAAVGLTIGTWGWLLSRRRMPVVPAMIVTAWLVLTATLPTPLGMHSDVVGISMLYNRQGYALLGIVLVECAFSSERSRLWGGFSTGVALTLLAFLKLSYFGIGVLLVMVTLPLCRLEMRRVWGVLAGIAVTFAAFSFYLRFAIPSFVSDMWYVIHARDSSHLFQAMLSEITASAELVTLAILTCVAICLLSQSGLQKLQAVRLSLLGCIVIVGGILLQRTNTAEVGYQLASMWALVLVALLLAAYEQVKKEKMAVFALVAVTLGGIIALFSTDAESVRTLVKFNMSPTKYAGVTPAAKGLGSLRFYDAHYSPGVWTGDSGHLYVAILNDGMALLNSSSTPEESVMTLSIDNPFSYLLRRKPPRAGSTWLTVGINLSKNHMLKPDRLFGDTALVMVPIAEKEGGGWRPNDQFLEQTYHSYLSEHFTVVGSSEWWTLYRRNK